VTGQNVKFSDFEKLKKPSYFAIHSREFGKTEQKSVENEQKWGNSNNKKICEKRTIINM
jgi:hypothetical protein